MTIKFDFDAPEVSAKASGISPGTTSVILTVPLASAPFPLSSGRMCALDLEAVGVDSAGGPLYSWQKLLIVGGSPPTGGNLQQAPNAYAYPGSGISPSELIASLNSSGDLDVRWQNNDPTKSHDVAVRVKARWVGNA